VIANIAHSHKVIVKAAKLIQNDERFKDDPSISKLKCTRTWIKGFLKRNAFCRRKATATIKNMPLLEEICAIMTDIQKTIETRSY
tara:strand:- start:433 stop:687 length:255 start_codon:yes stop_codon:yes gene_type:complete